MSQDFEGRINEVMFLIEDTISPNNIGAVKHRIRQALQKQDQITRESIAGDVSALFVRQPFHNACNLRIMSNKGGTK
jgi:hypothetical protein